MIITDEEIQMIRNESKQFEKTKQISNNVLELIYDQKLFKLFVPEVFGGKMLDLPRAIEIFQEASRVDGNFGWIVTIGSGGGMFVPNMKEETANHFYSPQDAVIAGSGFPAGIAEPTENGYMINGEWFYCSGSLYANAFTVTCIINSEDENKKEILAAVLKPEQVNVVKDWDAFGLKGTSSHSIKITDQFVPHDRIFSVFENKNLYAGFIHTLPFMLFSEASFAAITLGIGQHFLEAVNSILKKNKEKSKSGSNDRYVFFEENVKEAEASLKRANDYFHEIVQSTWNQHIKGNELSEELQQEFSTIAKRTAATSINSANNLFRHLGMQVVMESNSLNQIWRDLHTAGQHMFLTPNNKIESTPF